MKQKIKLVLQNYRGATRKCQFVVALFTYLGIDYLFFCHGREFSFRTYIFTPSGDPLQFIWCLNWWPFALSRGINPFLSYYVWAPQGFNMAWATAVPSLSLLAYPITYFAGAMATYNILSLLSLPLSAWSAYMLVRYITNDFFASLLAGYIFGFSSYALGQFLGHLHLDFICLIPLAVLITIKHYGGNIRRSLFITYLTSLIVFQCGISLEILATATFFGSAAIIFCFFTHNKVNRASLIVLAKDIVMSYILAAVILTPFFCNIIAGLKSVPPNFFDPGEASADLLNFVIPTSFTRIGSNMFQNIASRFTPNLAEEGAYFGFILIVITIIYIVKNIKEKRNRLLLFMTAVAIISSLGPYLRIYGINTCIPLIWTLVVHVPLLKHAQPIRLTMYISLAVAIWLAFWLSRKEEMIRLKLMRYALTVVGIAFILPNVKVYSWGKVEVPAFFEKQIIARYISQDDVIVVLPYGYLGNSMLWQYRSGMYFHMAGGYVGFTPDTFIKWPSVQVFYSQTGKQRYDIGWFKDEFARFCSAHDVKAVIAGPGTDPDLINLLRSMQYEDIKTEGVELFKGFYTAGSIATTTNSIATTTVVNQFVDNSVDNFGYFDGVHKVDGFLIAGGWARPYFGEQPAKYIVITDERKRIIATTKILFDRADVAKTFGDDRMLRSGWDVSFNQRTLGSGVHTLYAYLIVDDGKKAIRLNHNFKIIVP